MKQQQVIESGFFIVLLAFLVGLMALLVRSDIAQPARVLPYITAAIIVPLIGFKLSTTLSGGLDRWVSDFRERLGLGPREDIAQRLSRAEAITMGWVVLLVTTVYVLGLVLGIFLSVFAYVAYREGKYIRATLIAAVISGIIYIALPVFFNKLLWAGLLLG